MVGVLFDVRVEDLLPHHRVAMTCDACGHEGIVNREELVKRGIPPYAKVLGLMFKMRRSKREQKQRVMDIRTIQINSTPARTPEV